MKLAIVKYNAGNIQSVLYALERIGMEAEVTDDHALLRSADKVIFPGVGEASSAMNYLKERQLDSLIKNLEQPVLGICLGMQLMCMHSEENNTDCLGIFDTTVRRFSGSLKIPQIGWNLVQETREPLFSHLPKEAYCYFVHSYYADLCDETTATTEYGVRFSSALQKRNFYGVQFHPEKSASVGEQILKNFITL
ncbi:MAG: imidazole glycerol phosphate synthase subunit HisH [Chitinophagaceae bacterium]|nr:imidazole glycerol phosphate synthase subunit HisH [Chitinophagaceae bacterium]MCA6453256.1 imidazole glycerol phosphate synthase subunit HisH [Chitinophagaceae bacterium]MCA6457003.1 imidazole glycerol phosphate synthase subunit HisH [Chitinophagaceae bacterium]MCA6459230.1 imidazole glycerol phosphate synthase subunit HisH [Chitinophagaceae bacterium]MCA6464600.1 imidazole glycerol phosphate synthase subunit HisH [Chitinophagaceae bacterium]